MSELLDRLKVKYPHYKIISEPDPACGCKGAGERWVKPSAFWPEGRHTLCLCICLSGDGRAEYVQVFGKAAKKVANELRADSQAAEELTVAKPCMHYGIPCEAGTEGNCVCRKRFFASPPSTHLAVEAAIAASKDPSHKWDSQSDAGVRHG